MGEKSHIKIDIETKKDLNWWNTFLPQYNGTSILWMEHFTKPDLALATDASHDGAGVICGMEYFRFEWEDDNRKCGTNIAYLEMDTLIAGLRLYPLTILVYKQTTVLNKC